MKEIKFRAWDGLRMTKSGIQFSATDGTLTMVQNMPLMQYTGLKDKNGKEIYEGDIVTEQYIFEEIYVVKFEEVILDCFHFLGWNITNWKDKKLASNTEVIGNIYQNPELLEKIK